MTKHTCWTCPFWERFVWSEDSFGYCLKRTMETDYNEICEDHPERKKEEMAKNA